MMKKLMSILLVLSCFLHCSSSADDHIFLTGEFTGTLEGKNISLDVCESEGKMQILSSLIPDMMVKADTNPVNGLFSVHYLSLARPDYIYDISSMVYPEIRKWFSERKPNVREGLFSGDLFTQATHEKQWDLNPTDMFSFLSVLRSFAVQKAETGEDKARMISFLLDNSEKMLTACTDHQLHFRMKSYDEWSYIVFETCCDDRIVFSVSADFSTDNEIRFLLHETEEAKHYYHLLHIKKHQQQTEVFDALYSNGISTFHGLETSEPLISGQCNWKPDENNFGASFELKTHFQKISEPIIVSGNIKYTDSEVNLSAAAYISGYENESFKIRMTADETGLTEQKHINTQLDLNVPAQLNEIKREVFANAAVWMADIIPVIPSSYQKIVYSILFQ